MNSSITEHVRPYKTKKTKCSNCKKMGSFQDLPSQNQCKHYFSNKNLKTSKNKSLLITIIVVDIWTKFSACSEMQISK